MRYIIHIIHLSCVMLIVASWLWLVFMHGWKCWLVGVLITVCSLVAGASEVYHENKRNRK